MSATYPTVEADPVALASPLLAKYASAGTFTKAQIVQPDSDVLALTVKGQAGGSADIAKMGRGVAYGAPASAPTLASGGAGALTGVYQYAYTETDINGQTTKSPVASITASSEKVQVTLPLPRRGVSSRRLYRTAAGGSTFKLVGDLTSAGTGYFQRVFVDNLADGSLGATAPTSDTTEFHAFQLRGNGLQVLRCSPAEAGTSDLTILNADAATAGAYGIDSYGQILARTRLGNALASEVTASGNGAKHLSCNWISDTNLDAQALPTLTNVFAIADRGNVTLAPATDAVATALAITAPSPGASNALDAKMAGDSANRFVVNLTTGAAGVKLQFGDGTLLDAVLERSATARLKVSNNLDVATLLCVGAGAAGTSAETLNVATTGANDATLKLGTASQGNMRLKSLGASAECQVYTSNASVLKLGTANTARIILGAAGAIGFFGSAGTTQPTISGSRGGNAALADLLTKLASLGLIVDGSTA